MSTATVNIEQFIKDQRITMSAERVDSNPNMSGSANMDHWKVILTRKRQSETSASVYTRKMTTYFSMGYGHNGKTPSAAEVLDCLASDSSSIENVRGFEDWCSDFGYDTDSRQAEKTYKACEHAAKRLRNFMGGSYDALLYSTERM